MSAGLPGLGLGGLFFVISALLAPLFELHRTFAGRSSARAWRQVGRQFMIAVGMVIAVDLALRVVLILAALAGAGSMPSGQGLTVLPLAPIGITTGLMLVVLAAAKGLQLALRFSGWLGHRRRSIAPRPTVCVGPCTCCAQPRSQA